MDRYESEIHCPYCCELHIDEEGNFVTLYGDDKATFTCEFCEKDFLVTETVRRTYETEKK